MVCMHLIYELYVQKIDQKSMTFCGGGGGGTEVKVDGRTKDGKRDKKAIFWTSSFDQMKLHKNNCCKHKASNF